MAIYIIEANGTVMGEYEGATHIEARDAYAQDAGYSDYDSAWNETDKHQAAQSVIIWPQDRSWGGAPINGARAKSATH
jgi:hypothetical protein